MAQLLELARRIWGSNPTKEQIEQVRHEFANLDLDNYDFIGGSYDECDDGA